MRLIIIENHKARINRIFDWFVHIIGYTAVLMFISIIFKSIYIDNSLYGLWALIAVLIIYILNKTIKPIIFLLTLPITGLTLGVFYPFINVLILKIVDLILGPHFQTKNSISLFFAAILISIMNFIVNRILEIILKRGA